MAEQVKEPASPEHEKLEARKAEHQAVTDFLSWLEATPYEVVRWTEDPDADDVKYPVTPRMDRLVAEYFKIDMDAFYAEKDAMLAHIREVQGP